MKAHKGCMSFVLQLEYTTYILLVKRYLLFTGCSGVKSSVVEEQLCPQEPHCFRAGIN